MLKSIFSKKKKSKVTIPATVFWVETGSVYHTNQSCVALSKDKNVLTGSIEESCKDRSCKNCNM